MITKLKAWFLAQGGYYHVAALAVLFLVGGYSSVPPFKALCLQAWGVIPLLAREVLAAAGGLYMLYQTSHKVNQLSDMKATLMQAHLEVQRAREQVARVQAAQPLPNTLGLK
jgi:hypothetical protein